MRSPSFASKRRGDDKLLVHLKPDGSIRSRELYRLDSNPREEGYDLPASQSDKADELQIALLQHLENVHADMRGDAARKADSKAKKKIKAKEKAQ